jgi:CDP-diglyceride synthetase
MNPVTRYSSSRYRSRRQIIGMQIHLVTKLVLLLAITNGAPLIARALLGLRCSQPLDRNMRFIDGRPLLGPAKTLRGIVSALLATTLVAPLFDLSPGQGMLFAALTMAGDLVSSFTKRRLGIASSRSAPLLDQLPESLLPLWLMHPILAETAREAGVAILVFVVIDWIVSKLRDAVSRDAGDAG